MLTNKRVLFAFFFILLYISGYFLWISQWENDFVKLFGGNLFSIIGSLIAAVWLAGASKRTGDKREKVFMLLLSLGSVCNALADSIRMYYENVLWVEAPFPGFPDLFYLLQILFYLIAFMNRLSSEKGKYQMVRFYFDVMIIMTVAATFSWYFLIQPILASPTVSNLSLFVSLAYPIGDLALLFTVLTIYMGTKSTLGSKPILVIIIGLLILIYADSGYLYLISTEQYASGSLLDPLFILAPLMIGLYSFLYKETETVAFHEDSLEERQIQRVPYFRLLLPYVNVTLLLLFMIVKSNGFDALTIGTCLAILLLIIRQILVILENQKLLYRFYHKAEELEISEQRYKSLFEYHPDAAYSLDLDGSFVSVNEAATHLAGYDKTELIGMHSSNFIIEGYQHMSIDHLLKVKQGIPQYYEVPIHDRQGRLYYISITHIPIKVKNRVVGIFGIAKDITEMKQNEEKINYLAYHDSLTGLPNRALFGEILAKTVSEAERQNERFAVLFIDLDGFKQTNDTLGHDIGDLLLVEVAKRLMACCREGDVVARQSGDEFTCLIKGVSNQIVIERIAERIRDSLTKPYFLDEYEILSTPSIGIALYPDDAQTSWELMKKADRAMYHVKDKGKGDFKLFHTMSSGELEKVQLEKDILTALSNQEFILYYQPQVEVDSRGIVGAEALLRWKHPKLGILLPADFIPIVEEKGLMSSIGEWVLQEVCRQARTWGEQGHGLKVGVNISPRQLQADNFVEKVIRIIHETKVDPHQVYLEITESAAIDEMENVKSKLISLKQLGVQIAIDDFGTGYSSLSYLANFPIDTLKIPREFVSHIGVSEAHQTILKSIVNTGKGLNLTIIAEGVETESQFNYLKQLQCDQVQGYLFGKPTAKETFWDGGTGPVSQMNGFSIQNTRPFNQKK